MRVDDTNGFAHRLAADDDIQLATLTEEELGAVTRFDAPDGRLVPLPHFDRLPAEERSAALRAARRSLRERGLLDDSSIPAGNLAKVLQLRIRPRTIAIADRAAHGVATRRYLYGAPLSKTARTETFLEENADDDGFHHFTLRSHTSATRDLINFVDPDGRAQTDGIPRACQGMDASAGWREVDQALLAAEVVTRLFSTTKQPDATGGGTANTALGTPRTRRASVVTGPDGVRIIAGQVPANEEDAAYGALLFAQSVSRATLHAYLTAFVTPVRRRDHPRGSTV